MASFLRVSFQFFQFSRAQDRQRTGWFGIADNMGVDRRHPPGRAGQLARRNPTTTTNSQYDDDRVRDNQALSRSNNDEEVQVASGSNLILLGGFVEPPTAEVMSKEVFEGVAVSDDDTTEQGNNISEGPTNCLRKFYLVWFFSIVLLLLICILVGAVLFRAESEDLGDKELQSMQIEGNSTLAPSMAPTYGPTSQRVHDLIVDLDVRLQVPNSETLYDPATPQHQAALWIAEVDEYVPVDDYDFLQRYTMVVFFFSTKQDESPVTQGETVHFANQDPWNNPAWVDLCGFLGPQTHVCDWNCEWRPGVQSNRGLFSQEDDLLMGVYCPPLSELQNSTVRTVTGIQILQNGLVGTIPVSELNLLSSLRILNLSANKLSGDVHVGKLPSSLEQLRIACNQLVIHVQQDIATFSALRKFVATYKEITDLGATYVPENNRVMGALPSEIGELTNLEWLYMENVGLSGSLPTQLGRLTQLSRLSLSHNNLGGFVPSEMAQLTNLEVLRLESNPNLKGTLQGLCQKSSGILDVSADCLLSTISCSCCQTCCRPNGDCQSEGSTAQETP